MNILDYIKDKINYILINIVSIIMIIILLYLFNVNKSLIIIVTIIFIMGMIIPLVMEYMKKHCFYKTFKNNLEKLDRKYLITEMINSCNFLDGKLLLDYLYDINKTFNEEINSYKNTSNELKEYIELWCHEIKTPISTSKLIIENNSSTTTLSILEELDKIENFIEQVLFYSRSDIVEKDYIITNVKLKEVIDNVIKKNKKDLINKHIKIEIDKLCDVKSDSKWLEFIINQIVLNSIKYSKNRNAYIKFYVKENKNNKILYIEDNGIGIEKSELNKVFDKGFTGTNGRKKYNSTGIGLYLCKKLCIKLGLDIEIESIINEKTILCITFPNNSMIENLTIM